MAIFHLPNTSLSEILSSVNVGLLFESHSQHFSIILYLSQTETKPLYQKLCLNPCQFLSIETHNICNFYEIKQNHKYYKEDCLSRTKTNVTGCHLSALGASSGDFLFSDGSAETCSGHPHMENLQRYISPRVGRQKTTAK